MAGRSAEKVAAAPAHQGCRWRGRTSAAVSQFVCGRRASGPLIRFAGRGLVEDGRSPLGTLVKELLGPLPDQPCFGGQPCGPLRKLADLPAAARKYVDRLSQLHGLPVKIVSVGPDREQTIMC